LASIRNTERTFEDEACSILDGASAILSQNGGRAFSVKSNFLSSMKSGSNMSFASSTVQSSMQNITWSRYRSRTNNLKTGDAIFSSRSPAISTRVKGDKISPARYIPPHCGTDQPNLALKQGKFNDYGDTSSLNSTQKRKVPFPFLQNLLDSANKDGRFSKKMAFSIEPKKDVMKFNINLDATKNQTDVNNKVNKILEERS
jgi:hypothetical protein